MPNRIIRDGILTSLSIDKLSTEAELFYRRLMSVVDDFGVYPAEARLLRSSCYPLKIDKVKDDHIKKWLSECVEAGLLIVYEASGSQYVEIQNFSQRTRQQKSKWPQRDGQSTVNRLSIAHGDGDGDGDESLPDAAIAIASLLSDSILSWKSDFALLQSDKKRKTVHRWAKDVDLMMRLDKRSEDAIRAVIAWLPSHADNNFRWREQILSGHKLREKFDRLEMEKSKHRPQKVRNAI